MAIMHAVEMCHNNYYDGVTSACFIILLYMRVIIETFTIIIIIAYNNIYSNY